MSNQKKKKSQRNQAILILFFLFLVTTSFIFYSKYLQTRELFRIHFVSPDGKSSPEFALELSTTPSQRHKGLMFRKPESIPQLGGMFFIFPKEEQQKFWMKDTYTSLDIIFINSKLEVVGIIDHAKILNEKNLSVLEPSIYVVELHAGTAEKFGIKVGWKLKSKGIPLQ